MPPKKKGGKKKKKSKEELEAEAKARREEEARAREEEAKRLEKERLAREEAERVAKAEADRLRAEQLARLGKELEEDTGRQSVRRTRLEQELKMLLESEDWERFKECSRRPNAALEAELNTYITECSEEKEADLEAGLASCATTEEIVADLEEELARGLESGDTALVERCTEARRRLRDLSAEKVDRVTAHILQNAHELSKELKEGVRETMVAHGCDAVSLGIWVNLTAKGGRMRSVNFPDIAMTVDIPKPIATQLICVRVLHYPFDHAASTAAYIAQLADTISRADGSAAGAGSRTDKSRAGTRPGGRRASDVAEEKVEEGEGVPQSPAAVMTVLGGTFYVELLTLPDPPKRVRQWTLRRVDALASSVQRQPHPMASQASAVAAAQALKLRLTLPSDVVLPEAPRVAVWNADMKQWTGEGITEHTFDAESRTLTVHTIDLSAMAIVQERYVDFPYKQWRVDPVADHVAHVSLTTPRFEVKIEVDGTQCRLLEPSLPELETLRAKRLRPGLLLTQLAACGINLCPMDGDAPLCAPDGSINPKTATLEDHLYGDVAVLAAAFSVAGSKWNQAAPADAAVVRVKETLEYDVPESEVHETDWRTVYYVEDAEAPEGRRVGIIRATESSSAPSFDLAPAEVFHNNIRTTIEKRSTPESLDMVDSSRPAFQQTVHFLLRLLRPMSFA